MRLQERVDEVAARIHALEHAFSTTQLDDAKADIERLRAENEWLRNQQASDWALGLTDALPPSYHIPSRPA